MARCFSVAVAAQAHHSAVSDTRGEYVDSRLSGIAGSSALARWYVSRPYGTRAVGRGQPPTQGSGRHLAQARSTWAGDEHRDLAVGLGLVLGVVGNTATPGPAKRRARRRRTRAGGSGPRVGDRPRATGDRRLPTRRTARPAAADLRDRAEPERVDYFGANTPVEELVQEAGRSGPELVVAATTTDRLTAIRTGLARLAAELVIVATTDRRPVLPWFRGELRLDDHPALVATFGRSGRRTGFLSARRAPPSPATSGLHEERRSRSFIASSGAILSLMARSEPP
jgi:hypothetical protein